MDRLTQNQRSKNGTRETSVLQLGCCSSGGVCEQYRVSLERRIAQGDIDLVCGDEELRQRVQGMLKEGDPRGLLTAQGLNTLATVEDSLQAPPIWGGAVGGLTGPATAPGLQTISTAFQVLELAALNLYLCPWRKEYRVVKTFSGMFTHLVKPALSEQQVEQLFGLLGYQVKGAELELLGTPPSAATLLGLACAFFAARCESQLLSAAAATSGAGTAAELTLVQERQKGCSLQEALESLRGKAEVSGWGDRDELDLYTAEGTEFSGEMEVVSAGKELSTAPVCRESVTLPLAGGSSSSSCSVPSQRVHITLKAQQCASRSLGPDVSQTTEDGGVCTAPGQNQTCDCLRSPCSLYISYCQDCTGIHNGMCPILRSCRKNHHNLKLIVDTPTPGPPVGGASAEQWKEPRAGKGSAVALDQPKEGWASTALLNDSKVGEDSATAWDMPKEGGTTAERLGKAGEGRASGTPRLQLGVTCEKQDCMNSPYSFCKNCGFRLCKQCSYLQVRCICGEIFIASFPISSSV